MTSGHSIEHTQIRYPPTGIFPAWNSVRADEFDLDFGCRLCSGITKGSHTQEQLKALMGVDMEAFRALSLVSYPK
jgi:hypothetical protein